MNSPFPKFDGEPSRGMCGKPDLVAWQAMQNVMQAKTKHARLTKQLASARNDGHVVNSLALCEEVMQAEAEGNRAIAVCQRLAGQEATVAALRVGANVEGVA